MSDTPDESSTRADAEPTRRRVLQATAGALAVGAVSGHGAAQSQSQPQATGPTVYVGAADETLYAVDAGTGNQEWAFTRPSDRVGSSPTVVGGTVYVGSDDGTLYAVDAATGSQEWAFTQPSFRIRSSPTVVADPQSGDSIGSRVMLGTLGHRGDRADRVTTGTDPGGGDTDDETGTDGGGGDTDTQSGGDGFGPGFGVGGALAGVAGAGYLLKRRLETEEPE